MICLEHLETKEVVSIKVMIIPFKRENLNIINLIMILLVKGSLNFRKGESKVIIRIKVLMILLEILKTQRLFSFEKRENKNFDFFNLRIKNIEMNKILK